MPRTAATTVTPLTARVEVEGVSRRSAAWCALWRELFEIIEAEFAGNEGARGADDSAPCSGTEELA